MVLASIALLVIAGTSAYAALLSYQNITRLQTYEATSEKAAEWSNTAAWRLHKTRATQTSGTVAILTSLLLAVYLLFTASSHATILSLIASAASLFAAAHMSGFWNDQTQPRVPFVQTFNDAARGSQVVVQFLLGLGVGWGFLALGGMVGAV